jgi:hypothetical protein
VPRPGCGYSAWAIVRIGDRELHARSRFPLQGTRAVGTRAVTLAHATKPGHWRGMCRLRGGEYRRRRGAKARRRRMTRTEPEGPMIWQVYDRRAGKYDAMMTVYRYAPAVRDLVGAVAADVPAGGKVLDVGCGTGFGMEAVAERRPDLAPHRAGHRHRHAGRLPRQAARGAPAGGRLQPCRRLPHLRRRAARPAGRRVRPRHQHGRRLRVRRPEGHAAAAPGAPPARRPAPHHRHQPQPGERHLRQALGVPPPGQPRLHGGLRPGRLPRRRPGAHPLEVVPHQRAEVRGLGAASCTV